MNPQTPFSLPLAPMPASRMEGTGEPYALIPDGFVDDDVIATLLSAPGGSRVAARSSDLVLSSDENDFAGWSVQQVSPFRILAEEQERSVSFAGMEPELQEPGLGNPHRGGHRWWIATATGVSSALILSLLFSNLASRAGGDSLLGKLAGPVENMQSWLGSLAP